jgi:hypothetical protein
MLTDFSRNLRIIIWGFQGSTNSIDRGNDNKDKGRDISILWQQICLKTLPNLPLFSVLPYVHRRAFGLHGMPTSSQILTPENVLDFAKETLQTKGLRCQWGQCDANLNSWHQLQKVLTLVSFLRAHFLPRDGQWQLCLRCFEVSVMAFIWCPHMDIHVMMWANATPRLSCLS